MSKLRKQNLEPLREALQELTDFVRNMDQAEYSYFYRQVERMGNNVEICILVRYDGWEQLERILLRDWNSVKRMYEDAWMMEWRNGKEKHRFLQLLTEIEWYLEGKGLIFMEDQNYQYAN